MASPKPWRVKLAKNGVASVIPLKYLMYLIINKYQFCLNKFYFNKKKFYLNNRRSSDRVKFFVGSIRSRSDPDRRSDRSGSGSLQPYLFQNNFSYFNTYIYTSFPVQHVKWKKLFAKAEFGIFSGFNLQIITKIEGSRLLKLHFLY